MSDKFIWHIGDIQILSPRTICTPERWRASVVFLCAPPACNMASSLPDAEQRKFNRWKATFPGGCFKRHEAKRILVSFGYSV